MTADVQDILDAALRLPDDVRAELGAILLDSVGDGSSAAEIEEAWDVEIERRLEAVRSGRARLIPSEDVEQELEDIINGVSESRRTG
ncbi:MAG: addiction module protein [Myxococcota bacterium]